MSIQEYGSYWQDQLDRGGDDASAFVWAESGVRWRHWSLSVVTEQIALAQATPQTAALYHRVRNELPFTPGERFDIDLDVLFVRLQGLRLGRAFTLSPQWRAELGLSVYDGFDLVDGTLKGEATAVSEQEYAYRASLDYYYDQDVFFDRPTRAQDGLGLTVDLALQGRWAERWNLDLRLYDLPGRVWWKHAPRTTGEINSATRGQDEQGYTVFNPVLSGRESNRNFHQILPVVGTAALSYESGLGINPGARLRADPIHQLPSLTAALPLAGAGTLEFEALLQPRALGLAWSGRYGAVRLASDRAQLSEARLLVFGISFAITF